MYNIGDVVMYGTFGICKIASIEKRDFMGEENDYYILRHVYNEKNTFYVPVDNELAVSRLHKVCSKADVDELIGHMNAEAPIWIDNEIKRKEEYSRIIKEGNKHEIIRLIKTLYLRRKELYAEKKKLRSSDGSYLTLAENMLYEEFAYALDIDRSEVVDYIEKHIA
ncbi:transcriptional regulator, CarD family [Ruminococcus flavefaciens]|uniref:Transcriptional regulator, CarD family n=1 Tax=Ruminococcus flavefaciens TaxID=1265 RepID=A0A1H6KG63_RUMFL|nr:CarD family transcriptional regulator [Ruminococcus flavefaciens]SEH71679.1 transcriptional regulator, CarD family [Ruminococcus flavefaciens]